MKNNIISSFLFEEHKVMDGTALHHIPARTAFQLNGAPSHFSLYSHLTGQGVS
jgi:hypothetical protein